MSSEVETEISKLLYSSFNGGTGEPISLRDLARMWSLEMQWFSPEDAYSLVGRLQDSEWLVGEEDGLLPSDSCPERQPELGWRPFLPRTGEMPVLPEKLIEAPRRPTSSIQPICSDHQSDNDEMGTSKLAHRVASISGLEKSEVVRRAQRKRRALGPVSLEVAILLLAREQNLEMDELFELL